jgi:hypothetical protein
MIRGRLCPAAAAIPASSATTNAAAIQTRGTAEPSTFDVTTMRRDVVVTGLGASS